MSVTRRAAACAVLAAMVAAGCAVGPDYREPELPVPDAWTSAAAADLDTASTPLETWWAAIDDTLLQNLVAEARLASPDLAAAVGRVREAAALRRVAGGDRWPQVGLDGAWSRTDLAPNGPGGAAVAAGAPNPSSAWEFGLGAGWELDLFGRVRRTVEAADATLQASVEDYRDVLVTLYADVAATYVEARAQQARLALAEDNVAAQRETLELVQARLDAGLVSALDEAQARSNLANTLAVIPQLETGLEEARNRLAVLTGRAPGALDARLDAPHAGIPPADTRVAAGLPADLLRRRPDVRRSERRLAARTARVGVATADLYPSFSLSGSLVLQAPEFGDLGDADSRGWSLAPGVRWSLFSGGRVRGAIQAEEARVAQALAAYEATVLAALAEVEDALVALRQEEIRRDRLASAVEATQQAVALVHTQYLSGLADFQSYLDAQRSLTSQQDQHAASRGRVLAQFIRLNRALGGGWSLDGTVPVTSAPVAAPDRDDEEAEVER